MNGCATCILFVIGERVFSKQLENTHDSSLWQVRSPSLSPTSSTTQSRLKRPTQWVRRSQKIEEWTEYLHDLIDLISYQICCAT